MTVGNIVDRARSRLGDSDKTGWSDDSLIDLVDQAQQDIAKTAQVYKRTAYLGLVNNRVLSPLPSDCFQVNRVEYQGTSLAMLSREDQDVRAIAKGLHVIKNDLDMSILEISEPFEALFDYASFEGGHQSVIGSVLVEVDELGVATESSLDFTCSSPLGVVTDVEFLDTDWDTQETNFGDTSSMVQGDVSLRNVGTNLGVLTELDFGYD
ncbi:MAG: hypothetical protein DRG30_09475 [Epsilonproteobacteria bacterium]|nr:MAG: hypothetical protein DRG30_09475 [Campylobacterota bacterium]